MEGDGVRRLVVDLDGTICTQTAGEYHLAQPVPEVIRAVNRMWTAGWHVTIFTARGMRTTDGSVSRVEDMYREMTEDWLRKHRVCYDVLLFGKPSADVYVDDRGISIAELIERETDRLP